MSAPTHGQLFDHLYQPYPAHSMNAVTLSDREAQVVAALMDRLRAVDPEFRDLARDMSARIGNRLGTAATRPPATEWSDR